MVKHTADLDAVFGSLSDPTRRDILKRVSRRRLTIGEVAKIYERQMSLAAVSKHLKVLEKAKLIKKERHGREQIVHISPATLSRADTYLRQYQALWETRLDRLEAFLTKEDRNSMEQEAQALTIERVLKAPRERVWDACSKPEALRQWWGQPEGAMMTVCEVDFRVGGEFFVKVELPDGSTVWSKSVFKEIVNREKIVMEAAFSNEKRETFDTPITTITLKLEDADEGTRLTVVHEGTKAEGPHSIEMYREGWRQSLNRLESALAH